MLWNPTRSWKIPSALWILSLMVFECLSSMLWLFCHEKSNKVTASQQELRWVTFNLLPNFHRWASTSISMSAISDIRHRHLSLRYWRQICRTEKRHSDIGSVPISTSELIPISDIEEKNISTCRFKPTSLGLNSERYKTELLWLFV